MDNNSESSPISTYKLILPELYSEQRHRRDYSMKAFTYYTSFCAILIGWIASQENDLCLFSKLALVGLLLSTGVIGFTNLEKHTKAYSQTAKVIVKISQRLGLFENTYPIEWKDWGASVRRWPQYVMSLCGLVTIALLLFS